jgi:hypothetical protein
MIAKGCSVRNPHEIADTGRNFEGLMGFALGEDRHTRT